MHFISFERKNFEQKDRVVVANCNLPWKKKIKFPGEGALIESAILFRAFGVKLFLLSSSSFVDFNLKVLIEVHEKNFLINEECD